LLFLLTAVVVTIGTVLAIVIILALFVVLLVIFVILLVIVIVIVTIALVQGIFLILFAASITITQLLFSFIIVTAIISLHSISLSLRRG